MSDQEPGYDRRGEVEALLATDTTWLGDVWQALKTERPMAELAAEMNITPGPLYSYQSLINALIDGSISTFPSVAAGHSARIRSWLKKDDLSPQLRAALQEQEKALNAVASDPTAQRVEDDVAVNASIRAEAEQVPGIYVYTLPHYWRHKVDPENDQTYLKVGKSETDVFSRVRGQRTTALPEDPWLLRVYETDDAGLVERRFHAMLDAADHHRSQSTRGGREWFMTSLRILDWYATDQGLTIRRTNEDVESH